MKAAITQDDWTAALADLGMSDNRIDPDAKTARELAALWECGLSAAKDRIKKLAALGRLEPCRKWVPRSDGAVGSYRAPAYKLKKPAKGKK